MSNMLRIFTGTVEAVFPRSHIPNPFSGIDSYYYGSQHYQLASVNTDGPLEQVLCFADLSIQKGDRVHGFSCRKIGSISVGILVEPSLAPLLSLGRPLEQFLEYTAFRFAQDCSIDRFQHSWNMKYHGSIPQKEEKYLLDRIQSSSTAVLAKAKVNTCNRKTDGRYCRAEMYVTVTKPDGRHCNFQITRSIDHKVREYTHLPVLIYRGKEHNPAIHIFPIIPAFAKYMDAMDKESRSLLERFLVGNTFRMLGAILMQHRYNPDSEDNRYRIVITGKKEQNSRYYARPASLDSHNRDWRNKDADCESDIDYSPGTILEADVSVDSNGQYYFANLQYFPEIVKRPAPNVAKDTTLEKNVGLLTVREEEVSLWRSSYEDGDTPQRINSKNKSFKSDVFQNALHRQDIDLLHYDVLQWIGVLRYTTANFIFQLFLSGILPQDPQALSESQKKIVEKIISDPTAKDNHLAEGDGLYPIKYLVRNDGDAVKKIIHTLQRLGLVEGAGYRTRDDNTSISQVLIITEKGNQLLLALRRPSCKFDTFAYLRSTRFSKTILSANQLAIAYIQALNKHYPLRMEDLRISPCISPQEDVIIGKDQARVGFTLLVKNKSGEKEILLTGESIRNTVGLSKQLDDQTISEKIPRILDVVNRHAQVKNRNTMLTFVFTSYEEMISYADFIRNELKKLEKTELFHVYLTYDMLLMGPLDGSHFRFHPVTGNLERVKDMMRRIERCLQAD